jgi:hypothetical protein
MSHPSALTRNPGACDPEEEDERRPDVPKRVPCRFDGAHIGHICLLRGDDPGFRPTDVQA